MLYRAIGKTTILAPVRYVAGLAGGTGRTSDRVRDRRRDQMLLMRPRDLPGRPDPVPVPQPGRGRPWPGITSRLWDHDLASLFANVYRLGPRSTFNHHRLLASLASLASH